MFASLFEGGGTTCRRGGTIVMIIDCSMRSLPVSGGTGHSGITIYNFGDFIYKSVNQTSSELLPTLCPIMAVSSNPKKNFLLIIRAVTNKSRVLHKEQHYKQFLIE